MDQPIVPVMLKTLGHGIGMLISLPLRVRFEVLRRLVGDDRALSHVSEAAARATGLFGIYTRQAFYRHALDRCGHDIHFGYQTLLSKTDTTIGDRVYLGRFCTVGRVSIGDDTRIADGVQLLSGSHHHGTSNDGVDLVEVQHATVRIGKGVWIGANAVVMADIGDGAIVGAAAVVTRPVAPGVTVAGVPAREILKTSQSRLAA